MASSTGSSQQTTSNSNIDIGSPYTPRRPSPLISISVNHPLAQMARKIKNFLTHKQTLFSTTFSIKVTPIVAIVSILGLVTLFGGGITTAYQYGKSWEQRLLTTTLSPTPGTIQRPASPSPSPTIVSKTGTIQATYQNPPTLEPSPTSTNSATIAPSNSPSTGSGSSTRPILHYILVSRSASILYLSATTSIHLANYLGIRVLITGSYDSSKNTLIISKPEDIEVLQ